MRDVEVGGYEGYRVQAAIIFCASVALAAGVSGCGAGSAAASAREPAVVAEPGAPQTKASAASSAAESIAPKLVPEDVPSGAAAERDAALEKQAAKFVDAFWNGAPEFSSDGQRVAFVSNRDGLPQLYVAEVAQPTAPARRLFSWPERVQSAIATRDGTAYIFRSDQGADENWSYYRVSSDGLQIAELTPGERLNRDGAMVPHDAPQRLFYSARKMSEAASTLYEASTERAGSHRSIYSDPKPTLLSAVSRDGAQALVLRYASTSENYLLLAVSTSRR